MTNPSSSPPNTDFLHLFQRVAIFYLFNYFIPQNHISGWLSNWLILYRTPECSVLKEFEIFPADDSGTLHSSKYSSEYYYFNFELLLNEYKNPFHFHQQIL